jgi:hypothetical protein
MRQLAFRVAALLAVFTLFAWWCKADMGPRAHVLNNHEMVVIVGGTISNCQLGPIFRGANWECEAAPGTYPCDNKCDSDCTVQTKAADCAMATCWNCAAPNMEKVRQCTAVTNAKKSCTDLGGALGTSPCGNRLEAICFWDATAVPPACICRTQDLKDTKRGCPRTNCK